MHFAPNIQLNLKRDDGTRSNSECVRTLRGICFIYKVSPSPVYTHREGVVSLINNTHGNYTCRLYLKIISSIE